MYFIKKLFRLESLMFLGRGGIQFFDGHDEYYVDTENFVPDEHSKNKLGVRLFSEGIRLKNNNEVPLTEEKKRMVTLAVTKRLAAKKIRVTIE
ncbi:MAG TPA: hypothetical protein VHK91_10040 [Flavisolibacter sp.]|jgi:hypothetical protein|nr:hypothetical protein [Flavisolibacter sp.]